MRVVFSIRVLCLLYLRIKIERVERYSIRAIEIWFCCFAGREGDVVIGVVYMSIPFTGESLIGVVIFSGDVRFGSARRAIMETIPERIRIGIIFGSLNVSWVMFL